MLWPELHFALEHMAVKKGSVKECFIETALGLANVKSNRFGRRYIWNLQTCLTLHKVENLRTVKLSVLCVAKRTVCPCLSVGAIRGVTHKCPVHEYVPLTAAWILGLYYTLSVFSLGSVCTGGGLALAVECTALVIAPSGRGEHTEKSLKTDSAYGYLSCWAWAKQ